VAQSIAWPVYARLIDLSDDGASHERCGLCAPESNKKRRVYDRTNVVQIILTLVVFHYMAVPRRK
jgi:hypothetical protein